MDVHGQICSLQDQADPGHKNLKLISPLELESNGQSESLIIIIILIMLDSYTQLYSYM